MDITDAITAIRSNGLHASLPSNKERIISLLDTRRRGVEIRRLGLASAPSVPNTPASPDEIVQLLDLHRIAIFLLNDYCNSAPNPKWMDQAKWNNEVLPLHLSETEKVRWFRGFYRLQIFANIFGPIEFLPYEFNGDKRDYWVDETFTIEQAWRVLFGTMAPWEVAEVGCVFRYLYEKYTGPYNEIADRLARYGRVTMDSLPQGFQIPVSCIQWDATDLTTRAVENLPTLASMGPTFLYRFLHQESALDRRNLILANGRPSLSSLPDICPGSDGSLPLLYPADRFNFGADLDGLKNLLATLPPSERPNLLCDRYFLCFYDESDVFEEMFDVQLGSALWRWGYALWDDERLQEWNPPMDYTTAFKSR